MDLFGNEVVTPKLIDRGVLGKVLEHELRGINEHQLAAMVYSKFDAIMDYARLCNGEKVGDKISLLFNPHRLATPKKGGPSLIHAFDTDLFSIT